MSRNLADTAAWSVVKIVGGAILAALAIGALLAWLAYEAFGSEGVQLAHGDAAWIMADPATRHCCGPQDCHEIDKDRVRYAAGLYVVDGVTPPGERITGRGFARAPGGAGDPLGDHVVETLQTEPIPPPPAPEDTATTVEDLERALKTAGVLDDAKLSAAKRDRGRP